MAAAEPPVNDYTVVAGARHRRAPLAASTSWSRRTPRAGRSTGCPTVDRNALRIGVFEILYVDEVPDAVAVSEA